MNVLDIFSGIGGFSLGLERAGMRTVAFCEIDPYCRAVLRKHWPDVPCYEDVRLLTAQRMHADGIVADVICGGFPCQDVSFAGSGLALDGERSGLWSEMFRLIREVRPRYAIIENVAALAVRGLGQILRDLASIRFDAEWDTVSACSLGAPHMRRRMFIVAYPDGINGWSRLRNSDARKVGTLQAIDGLARARTRFRERLANPSALYRGADGLAFGMERNRAIGNSVFPQIPEIIGRAIMSAISTGK